MIEGPMHEEAPRDGPTFPFGGRSTPRSVRRAERPPAKAFVLGVYPSALHVRWTPPKWAKDVPGVGVIGALAVADEPTVFWDGDDPDGEAEVSAWRAAVGFRSGDEPDCWGHVSPAGNGTSGRPVLERVLGPLWLDADEVTFSDCVNTYFVKDGGGSQLAAWLGRFAPFANELGMPAPSIPARPAVDELVAVACISHRDRLRGELVEAAAPLVVTLGEEARRVLGAIADEATGPPTVPLARAETFDADAYGEPGRVAVDGHWMRWMALVHPGQRSAAWTKLHDAWMVRRQAEADAT